MIAVVAASGIVALGLLLLSSHKYSEPSQKQPERSQLSLKRERVIGAPAGDSGNEPHPSEEHLAEKVALKTNDTSAESADRSLTIPGQSVSRLQEILQSSADDDTKELAAEALAKVGTDPAARALIAAIRGAKGRYRDNLMQELRNLSNANASVPLVETLRDLEDMPLHREARRVLLKIDSPVPAQTLVAAMGEAQSEQQRIALAYTISMLSSQEAIPVLDNAGRSADELLATRSFMGLARIGGAKALAALTDLSNAPANQTGERAEELRTAILRATSTTGKPR